MRWGSTDTYRARSGPDAGGEAVVLLVLAPTGECAESIFLGPVGRAWSELARSRGAVVCAVEVDRREADTIRRLVDDWKRAFPAQVDVRVIVVARADTVAALPFLFPGDTVPVDGFVLCTERSGRSPVLPDVPTLVVTGVLLAGEPAPGETRVRDPKPVFLRELTLPDRISTWLAEDRRD